MSRGNWRVAALLFGSGACALTYQTVWLRQFRLIFGASTWATAAVLAIFMAGLGIGSAILGKRADASERPLMYYARLELFIALAAAASPFLLALAARVYFASGGSPALGIAGATLLRLLLSLIVLGPATLLMGGTLPAAARAIESDDDVGRRSVALLYGVNTLGAVAGTLLATFVLLETFGNRLTLFMAVLVNVLVAIVARATPVPERPVVAPSEESGRKRALHVLIAAFLAGFAFLLMELVWYRMLSPILGGTTYMFGLVLAVALAGIGLGGAAYAWLRRGEATVTGFAMTCSIEALAMAVPFALGDRIAYFANVLRALGTAGFGGHVLGWTIVTLIVVFPAAFASGVQFPMLIGLLGRGREHVGSEIGAAYAWNTAGAIAGSLAGGFGLLPLLTAPGTWRLAIVLLAVLAIAFSRRALVPAALAILACFAIGPTAFWRHAGIGAARMTHPKSRNELHKQLLESRRMLLWDRDGRESSVATLLANDVSFIVNGKSDGSARGDADTQVMLGVLPAMLHPNPRRALVVGLGTGSTAGWLGVLPTMQRVDVVELEPVVIDVARECSAVNAEALRNPRVHVTIGDAREVLLTSGAKYDVIASEPSNPYRAGIASLLTREFYEAARDRLTADGILAQWTQAYSIDADTMRTIYATLTSVFPNVQTWRTSDGDLVLLASRKPIAIDADALRARLALPAYRVAAMNAWRVGTAEGILSRLIANETFARAAASEAITMNTDDRTVIEFGFARSIDEGAGVLDEIAKNARAMNLVRPAVRGVLDPKANIENLATPSTALIEADVGAAMARVKESRFDDAAALLQRAFVAYRTNAWPDPRVMMTAINTSIKVARTSPERARLLAGALAKPFAAWQQEDNRHIARIIMTPLYDGCGAETLAALRDVEPNPYWTRDMLVIRAKCYAIADAKEKRDAQRDFETFNAAAPKAVVTPPQSRPAPRGSS